MNREYDSLIDGMGEEEMAALARMGFFVRDIAEDRVFCPMGFILHKKSVKKNGCTRYCSKHACSSCGNRCFIMDGKKKWKEIDFPSGCRIKGPGADEVLKSVFHDG